MERYESAIEDIWIILKNYRDGLVDAPASLCLIEQTLVLLESIIQDDFDKMERDHVPSI